MTEQHHVIDNISYGTAIVRTVFHFAGGLRASEVGGGVELFPALHNGKVQVLKVDNLDLLGFGRLADLKLIGADEINDSEPDLPARAWTPWRKPSHHVSSMWGAIAGNAHMAGDLEAASNARNISLSLRASGIRLRDASDHYHNQLCAALRRKRPVGRRFKNLSTLDLHLSFHSALAEMAGARDYLAKFAARRVNAPAKIDALNRLIDWVVKPANANAKNDHLVARLLAHYDSQNADPWLFELSEFRNKYLHKEHMGAGNVSDWLLIIERSTVFGPLYLITMNVHRCLDKAELCDALVRFFEFYCKLEEISEFAANLSSHSFAPVQFIVRNSRETPPSPPRSDE